MTSLRESHAKFCALPAQIEHLCDSNPQRVKLRREVARGIKWDCWDTETLLSPADEAYDQCFLLLRGENYFPVT